MAKDSKSADKPAEEDAKTASDIPLPLSSVKNAAVRTALPDLVERYLSLKDQAKIFNDEADEVAQQIKELGFAAKINKVREPTWLMSLTSKPTLSKTKLIEEGVGIDVIERCTVQGKKYYLIRRVEPKDNKRGD